MDYWEINFDLESCKEVIRLSKNPNKDVISEDQECKEVWTGDYVFENEWQISELRIIIN